MKKLTLLLLLLLPLTSNALDRTGRLGVGYTAQLQNNIPAISFKLQKNKAFAFGGLFSLDTAEDGGWGAGLKLYRNIFDEPQLNFYAAAMGALTNKKNVGTADTSGFQFDLTMGSEFSFTGLQSIGFSFEFGISLQKETNFSLTTAGHNFLVAGVHFYL